MRSLLSSDTIVNTNHEQNSQDYSLFLLPLDEDWNTECKIDLLEVNLALSEDAESSLEISNCNSVNDKDSNRNDIDGNITGSSTGESSQTSSGLFLPEFVLIDENSRKKAPQEESDDALAEKSKIKQRITNFDAGYEKQLEKLDKEIKAAKAHRKTFENRLQDLQTGTLNIKDKRGELKAQIDSEQNVDNKAAKARIENEENELNALEKITESKEKEILRRKPTRERDLSLLKSVFQISSGLDIEVEKGEKQLLDLIKDNPRLTLDAGFRDLIIEGYAEMAAFRKARGLPPWDSKLEADDVLANKDNTDKNVKQPGELLDKASRTFFEAGLEEAKPLFAEAIRAQEKEHDNLERKRIELFINGIRSDANIFQALENNVDASVLIEKRAEQLLKEEESTRQSIESETLLNSFKINYSFARIASGNKAETKEAMMDLLKVLKEQPELAYDNGYKNGLDNAFKAHYERSKPAQNPAALPEKQAKQEIKDNTLEIKYQELDLNKRYRVEEIDNEIEGKPYAADTATDIGLLLLGLGMGAATLLKARRSYLDAYTKASYKIASSRLEPVEGLPKETVINYPATREASRYGIEGRARDGRLVIIEKNSSRQEAEAQFRVVKPHPDFRPGEMKFGPYTPISVDGKTFYADKEGSVFEQKGELLTETDKTRKLRLVPESEITGQLKDKIPRVDTIEAEMLEHRQALLPENLRKQVDLARAIKSALLDTSSNTATRLDVLERAAKQLNSLETKDQEQAIKELSRELKETGVEIKWEKLDSGKKPVLLLTIPESESRLIIDPEKGPATSYTSKKNASNSYTDDLSRAADEMAKLVGECNKRFNENDLRNRIIARDNQLSKDAFPSRNQIRTAFIEHMPEAYESMLPERYRNSRGGESVSELIKSVLDKIPQYQSDSKDPSKAQSLSKLAACLESGAIKSGLPIEELMELPREAREILNQRMEEAQNKRLESLEQVRKSMGEPKSSTLDIVAEFSKLHACNALVDAKLLTWKEASIIVASSEPLLPAFLDLLSNPGNEHISRELANEIKRYMLEGKINAEHLRVYTELMAAGRLSSKVLNSVIIEAPGGLEAFNKGLERNLASLRKMESERTGGSLSPLETKRAARGDLERTELHVSERGAIEHRAKIFGPRPRVEERLFETEVKSLKEAIESLKKEKRSEEARRLEKILAGLEKGDVKAHRSVLEAARRNRLSMEGLHAGGWLILASTAMSLIIAANLDTPERRGGTATIGGK